MTCNNAGAAQLMKGSSTINRHTMGELRKLLRHEDRRAAPLRERAAQARRLANATTDKAVADTLYAYAVELETEAEHLDTEQRSERR